MGWFIVAVVCVRFMDDHATSALIWNYKVSGIAAGRNVFVICVCMCVCVRVRQERNSGKRWKMKYAHLQWIR